MWTGLSCKDLDIYQEADRLVLNQYAPAGVLINERMDILQFRGDTSRFLRLTPGRASLNLLQMAREGLLMDLRTMIAQAQLTGGTINREGVQVRLNRELLNVTIRVVPLNFPPPLPHHYVILFEETTLSAAAAARQRPRRGEEGTRDSARQLNNQLAQELEATKQYLQSIIERYEMANEELKSANEEILSSNEELQSTNEELETAKEELQSTNEELSTVNDELRQRNQELGEANNDLNNLFSSANLPIIVLSGDLRIRRFTVSSEKVLNVIPTDIGRPIGHLNLNIDIPDLESLILEAIDSMTIKEREVQDREGHWYSLRIRPYRTADNRIDGAMLIFIDIDSYKDVDRLTTMLAAVETVRDCTERVVQTAPWPLLILDEQLRVINGNAAFYEAFQTLPEETEGQFIYALGSGQWNIPELRSMLGEIIPQNAEFHTFTVTHDFPVVGEKTFLLNARRIRWDEHVTDTILLGIKDITQQRQAEERITAALRDKEVLLTEVHHRVNNSLQIIASMLGLQADTLADEAVRNLFQENQRRIQAMSLVHQRLYGSENLSSIDMSTYLQSLSGDLAHMYDTESCMAVDIQAEGQMNIDTAIPCGLMVTELISNAFKYTFPETQPRWIRVTLRPEAENRWLLVVQDNCISIPSDMDIAETNALDLTLVHDLVRQLEGSVQVDRSPETTFTIHFRSAQPGWHRTT